jgi:transposase-like protein
VHTSGKRRRRRHSEEFKAEAVAACRAPGVSLASVALARGLNANLLRRWVVNAETRPAKREPLEVKAAPKFLPVSLASTNSTAKTRPIRIRVRRGASKITVEWPTSASAACIEWLREWLG